jgi:hypothetical protein
MSTSPQDAAAIVDDAQGLVRGYERLRQSALERRRVHRDAAGRSVLRRQGMAAWMRLSQPQPRSGRARCESSARAGAPVRSDWVGALAGLVLEAREQRIRA